jgi:D-arabinitol dehydrogenase (NADP+)
MKAIVYNAPEKFELKDIKKPKINSKQVLVKVMACGICITDINIHYGQYLAEYPLVNGHEFSGIVEAAGSEVLNLKPGDRVCCDNTVLCGECYYCKRDKPLYCENFYSMGCNGQGGFAQYAAVNSDKVFLIKDSTSFEEATFVEPIACAVHGMDSMDVQYGDEVLLYGAGPTGIILAQMLRHGGAGRVVVAAPTKFKLDILNDYGIRETIQISRNDWEENDKKLSASAPKGFDVVIEATGSETVVENCFKHVKRGGKVVIFGVAKEEARIEISPFQIFFDEIKVIGSNAQTHCFDRALGNLENGIVKVDQLITHTFPIEEYEKGIKMVMDGKDSVKIIIHPNAR